MSAPTRRRARKHRELPRRRKLDAMTFLHHGNILYVEIVATLDLLVREDGP